MDNMRNSEDYKEKPPKGNGKRKSDTEFGNMKKKVRVAKDHQSLDENQRQTRSKRKATGDTLESPPKLISKFVSETSQVSKGQCKESESDLEENFGKYESDNTTHGCGLESPEDIKPIDVNEVKPINRGAEQIGFELVEKLFQGQLVLRTRCLECESLTERREDFQDISVPVQEDELSKAEESSEIVNSGITISSGHYTASVKVTDLNSLELDKENFVVDQMCEVSKPEPLNEEEARGAAENYDDEEVSMRVGGNTQPSKVLNKKNVEAIGLLGGQKSKADYELYNKASNPDRAASTAFAESRSSETNSSNGTHEVDRNQESSDQTGIYRSGFENKISCVVQSLKEYEGKWLLFDDSEVKVTEEKDFLNSLSPSTSSTSTPYLLFYKKL
ncbi:Ubiquitin carboxyl-terminal hydrolase 1 [Heterocephalus glaber]|uniref:Ubiquitin carboxyl-terminal hydrolase 1 n=1 Tax=Heterocephalus glaber TaxID=10181 RepID=G5BSM9_HETGA|nr:Ubiquitin carboxyl-terminal hydrolase 1 [Heterocephalus glaber]